ncbi:DUF2982 domain-containing protein [Psychrosphaera sp. 1_MG-2023]|uniref:DUF2982 domain-containing protein n=1 Tax=Psychrosphaera sp. 1_MG-2023 TaxID=3062643 RepID=UPI0026E47F39|nr:DUF2982 domain-containing protein [Psychrosphaera sp. 1_MG-2023]MDO6719509.1 DUF2982 domain-containing protein [Psychrosphaera sp. 1_MG-2023]
MTQPIFIESTDSDNSETFIKFGFGLAGINFVVHFGFLSQLYIANMFLYGFAIAMLLLGYLKRSEPRHRLKLADDGLTFYHRANTVFVPWENIQRVGIPAQDRIDGGKEYDFIGIKVKDPELFYDTFPLRLASKLLIEQRPLWLALAGKGCATGQCVPEDFIDSVECKLGANRIYRGLIAMFVHRSEKLNELLGFHFYINSNGISGTPANALKLIQDTKNENMNR